MSSDISSEEESVEMQAETQLVRRIHKKKQLTYKRKVHSIDSALCEDNYELIEPPLEEKIITGEVPDARSTEKNKKDRVK